MTDCLECLAQVAVPSDAIDGEIVTCNECGSAWELQIANGLASLKQAETVGEDWGE